MSNSAEPRTGNREPATEARPRVLTNMVFWQSAVWTRNTRSIYDVERHEAHRAPHPAWLEAFRLLGLQSRYDVVVTMGARESLAYGLLCALLFRPSRQIMCEVFIDEEHSSNPLWKLKTALYRLVARRSIGVLTNSSAEVESVSKRFGIPRAKVRYVPMHSNIHEPSMSDRNDGFVLSAGRTLRDYDTLLKVAPRIKAPILMIAGGRHSISTSLPENVTLLREISREQYLDHLRRCAVVAIPLIPSARATGQVVLLEAMAYGKPVVATRSAGTADHIEHGRNGLLVEPGAGEALAHEINWLLGDQDLARRIGQQAVEDVKARYTFDIHAEAKLEAIRELASEPQAL